MAIPSQDQINEVLAPCELGAIEASNDRIGGWQLMYQMLARGLWLIADTCPQLIAAIPSRIHGPKKPGDLLKVGGDPLDDVMDSARYGVYSFVTASDKPLKLRMREAVQGLDMQSTYIRCLQMKAEEEYNGQPIRLGRRSVLPNWTRRRSRVAAVDLNDGPVGYEPNRTTLTRCDSVGLTSSPGPKSLFKR